MEHADTPRVVDEIEDLREYMFEQDDYLTRAQYGTLLGLLAVAESLQAIARELRELRKEGTQ